MKKFLGLIAFGVLVSTSLFAQSVDELIAKHVAARGGIEKIKGLKSMRAEGSIAIQGMDIPLKLYGVDKKAFKLELTIMDGLNYQLITDTKGWSFFPIQGQTEPTELSADDLKSAQNQLDLAGPLIDYKEKNIKVEYGGKKTVDGKECSVLKFTRPTGETGTFFLDDKFLVFQKTETVKLNGQSLEQTTTYQDYQKTADGYVYAASWTAANGGQIAISKFEANPKIEDSIFKP